jgi:hypothetical protein
MPSTELMQTPTREPAQPGGRHHRNARPASIGTGGRFRSESPAGFVGMRILAGASVIFSETGTAALGYPDWINHVCASTPLLCNNPQQLGIAAGVFGGLWIMAKAFLGHA